MDKPRILLGISSSVLAPQMIMRFPVTNLLFTSNTARDGNQPICNDIAGDLTLYDVEHVMACQECYSPDLDQTGLNDFACPHHTAGCHAVKAYTATFVQDSGLRMKVWSPSHVQFAPLHMHDQSLILRSCLLIAPKLPSCSNIFK